MRTYVSDTGSTDTSYTDSRAAEQGVTYTYQVKARVGGLTTAASNSAAVTIPGTCPISGGSPVEVPISDVPIVVTSTTADYFVLYVLRDVQGNTVELPVLVKLGEAGTTTLTDSLIPLPAEKYRVKKHQVTNPADVDGDCIDDLTELRDLGTKSPVNRAKAVDITDGAVAIPDRETFETLSYQGDWATIDRHLSGLEIIKFYIFRTNNDRPAVYFMNTGTHRLHPGFVNAALGTHAYRGIPRMRGEIVYHPNVVAPDGSLGVYRYQFQPSNCFSFEKVAYAHEVLAASMPFLENNLAYYPMPDCAMPRYYREKALYDTSRVNVLLEEDILPDVDFISLNPGEGYGYLRIMRAEERPNPRDVVIYETLPNDLPRVAGIITAVPQTPLSHVNLRAVQDNIPNAFIRDALDDSNIDDLLGTHVHYQVTRSGYSLRAATKAEVDAHYESSRPAKAQTPERDLSVTGITALGSVRFGDWDAFGVKAANLAVLGTLNFPEGTVPDGFAVPFHFYDEFMKNAVLAEETLFGKKKWAEEDKFTLPAGTKLNAVVTAILAHHKFQTDYEVQEEMLDDLRDAIKDAASPQWIIDALTAMHATYPEGQSLRYRSSTNNEDLPGFSGAGLYDSKTQDPDETTEDGIDKSIKAVWASLWSFRAFAERDFHRIDHTQTAMGVLVHPNYSDELVNGVAVSFDPFSGREGAYYVNALVGEDLVTNPEAHSSPEEVLLLADGSHEVLAYSNQKRPRGLLMSDAQMAQLRRHLTVIHDRFAALYQLTPGEQFAMEIEFKITSSNVLAIKQARPWVFPGRGALRRGTPNRVPTVSRAIEDVTIVNESGTRQVSLLGVFEDADNDSVAVSGSSSNTAVATVLVASDYSSLTVQAKAKGTATITVTADDGSGGTVSDAFTVTVHAAPVSGTGAPTVASPLPDLRLVGPEQRAISLPSVFHDPDGDSLLITAVSSHHHIATMWTSFDDSTLTVVGMSVGTATITVTAQDPDGNTVSDQFRVTVASPLQEQPNEPPTVSAAISDTTIVNQSGTKRVSLSGVFADADSDSLTITATSSDTAKATVSVAAGYSNLTVTAKARGTATITVTADDGRGGTVQDAFTVTVKAAPTVASAISDVSVLTAGDTRDVSLSGVFNDPDNDALTITAASSNDGKATVSVASDGSKLTLNGVAQGTATITVTAQDSDGNRVSDRFSVTVAARQQQQTNQAPTVSAAISDTTIVNQSGTKRVSLSGVFTDADSDTLTITATSSDTAKATVSVADDYSSLTVTAKARGTATMTVTADDGRGGTVQDAFAVTVKSAPTVASAVSDVSGLTAGDTRDIALSGVFSDPDNDALTVTASSSDDGKATVSVASDGSKLTLAGVAQGTATVTVTAQDSDGNRVSDQFSVAVVAPQQSNRAPTVSSAIADATIVNQSGTKQVSLSGVFTDADSDALTITATSSDTAKATVSVAGGYSSLTVTAKARGTATITATANDGRGGTVQDVFTVTVKAAPTVASAITDVSGLEVGSTQDVSLSGVFSDADNDALTVTAVSSDTRKATVSVASDGSKLILAGVADGTATVTITAQDSDGNRVSDQFSVTVTAPQQQEQANQPPTVASAIADATIVHESGTQQISLSGVFADADNDALTVTAASSDTAKATVSVAAGYSSLTVTAKARGTATITVTAADGAGGTVADTFTVTVKSAPTVDSAISDISDLTAGSTRDVPLSGVFRDPDGDVLTITPGSSNDAVATVVVWADQSRLTLTGVAAGTATITVTAEDADGNRVSDAFDVTVAAPQSTLSGVAARYDANGDGAIDGSEYQQVKNDWLSGKITYDEFLEAVRFHLRTG